MRQLVDHVRRVGRQTRMEEPFRQVFRVAAVALVQAYHVHPTLERFRGEAAHVVRVARSVQAVEGNERRVLPRSRVPVASGEDARVDIDIEVAVDGWGEPREIPGISPAVEGHSVTAGQGRPRHKFIWPSGHLAIWPWSCGNVPARVIAGIIAAGCSYGSGKNCQQLACL